MHQSDERVKLDENIGQIYFYIPELAGTILIGCPDGSKVAPTLSCVAASLLISLTTASTTAGPVK